MQSAWKFSEQKLLAREISMVKISQSSTELGDLNLGVPTVYTRDGIPLGAWVHPSVTNDHPL